jgi:hypothetical protein
MPDPTANPPAEPVWPSDSLKSLGTELSAPIMELLENIRGLDLPKNRDGGVKDDTLTAVSWKGTPESVQVITAGATAFSKWWAGVVAAVGGLGAVGTIVNQGLDKVAGNPAMMGSLAIIIAAALLSIAIIVRSDLMARAQATTARRGARATVVEAFLNNYQFARPDPSVPAPLYQSNFAMRKAAQGEWQLIQGLVYDSGILKVRIKNELVPADQVKDILDLRVVADQLRSTSQ